MSRVSRRGRPEAHGLECMLYWELHGANLPSVLASSRVRRGPAPGLVGGERLPTRGRRLRVRGPTGLKARSDSIYLPFPLEREDQAMVPSQTETYPLTDPAFLIVKP